MENIIEIWKCINELDDTYEVSNLGNIQRKPRMVLCPWSASGYRMLKERKMRLQDNGNGYKQLAVRYNRKRFIFYVHRLVAKYFIDNPDNKVEVNHKNAVKSDNKVSNLEWLTINENRTHAKENNLICKGERSRQAKLTESIVLDIRKRHSENPNINKLALSREFGVKDTTIHKIINRERWRHI